MSANNNDSLFSMLPSGAKKGATAFGVLWVASAFAGIGIIWAVIKLVTHVTGG